MKLLFIFLLLISCSTNNFSKSFQNDLLLRLFPKNSTIIQLLQIKRNDQVHQYQAIIKNQNNLKISILDQFGLEVFNLTVDSDGLQYSSIIPEFKVHFLEIVLTDMLAVYGKKDVLYKDKFKSYSIVDTEFERRIKKNKNLITTIYYETKDRWNSKIKIVQHFFGYEIEVIPLRVNNGNIHK